MPGTAAKPKIGKLALAALLVMELAKRLGFASSLFRFVLRSRILSPRIKRRAFRGFEPDERDVFVATYAKSGTNWMMQIAQQVAYLGDAEFDHIHQWVSWPDSPGANPVPLSDTSARDAAPTGLRIIKTHLEPEFVPYCEKATYLTVIRDPKEVVVSSYYFIGGAFGMLDYVGIDDWFEFFMQPNGVADTWAAHTAGYWSWRHRANVEVFDFGEVKREPERCIQRVAGVMGVELDHAQFAKVSERASFEYMKAHESQFGPPQAPFGRRRPPTLMIRRGETGASDELLSRTQQAAVDRHCQRKLLALGSDFPYRERFTIVEDTTPES